MRTIGGECGDLLQLTMNIAAAWQATVAVGDLCALDTAANFTVKDSVNDTPAFGKVIWLAPDSTYGTVEIYGNYSAVRAFTTDAALAVGAAAQIKGAGANIVDAGTDGNGTLVISDPGAAGTAYVLV